MFEQSLQLVVTALASVVYWFDRFMSSFPLFITLFASFFAMHRATQMLVMKLGMQRSDAVRQDLMEKQKEKQKQERIKHFEKHEKYKYDW